MMAKRTTYWSTLNRVQKIITVFYVTVIMISATVVIAVNVNSGWQIFADTESTSVTTNTTEDVSNEIEVVPTKWQLITIPRNFSTSDDLSIEDVLTCKDSGQADYEALYFKGINLMETIADLAIDINALNDPDQFAGIISQFETSSTINTASGALALGHGYLIQPESDCETLEIDDSLTVPTDDEISVALPSDKNTNVIGNPYAQTIGKFQVNVVIDGTRKSLKTAFEDGDIERIVFYHAIDNQIDFIEHYAHNGLEFLANEAFMVEMAESGHGVQMEFVKRGDESCNLEPDLAVLQLDGGESVTLQIGYCEPDDLPLNYTVVGPEIVTGEWVENESGKLKLTGEKIPTNLTTILHIEANDTGRETDISIVVTASEDVDTDPVCSDATESLKVIPGGWNLVSLDFEPSEGIDLNKLMPSSTLYSFIGYGQEYAPGGSVRRGDGFWLRNGFQLICIDKTLTEISEVDANIYSVQYSPDNIDAQELILAGNPFDTDISWTNVKVDVDGFGPMSLSDAFKAKAVIGVFLWDPENFNINNDYITFVDKATTTSGNASSLTDYTALEDMDLKVSEGFWIMTASGKSVKMIYEK